MVERLYLNWMLSSAAVATSYGISAVPEAEPQAIARGHLIQTWPMNAQKPKSFL